MATAFETLVGIFQEEGIQHHVELDLQLIEASFRGEFGRYRVCFFFEEGEEIFQILVVQPCIVPEGCRPAVGEAINRVNWKIKIGKFEMNHDDGELRYHLANCFPAGTPDPLVVRRLIGTALRASDRYFPAWMSIIYGNELPEVAVECDEGGTWVVDRPE